MTTENLHARMFNQMRKYLIEALIDKGLSYDEYTDLLSADAAIMKPSSAEEWEVAYNDMESRLTTELKDKTEEVNDLRKDLSILKRRYAKEEKAFADSRTDNWKEGFCFGPHNAMLTMFCAEYPDYKPSHPEDIVVTV